MAVCGLLEHTLNLCACVCFCVCVFESITSEAQSITLDLRPNLIKIRQNETDLKPLGTADKTKQCQSPCAPASVCVSTSVGTSRETAISV